MEEVADKTINGERIAIDEKRYLRCTFVECSIVFSGGEGGAINCTFQNCGLALEGAAVRTLQYLRNLATSGAAQIVAEFGLNHAGASIRFDAETTMPKRQPDLIVDNCDISDNRGAAVHIEGDATARVSNSRMERNAAGVVKRGGKKGWHERPLGVIGIGLLVAVGGGVLLYFLGVA